MFFIGCLFVGLLLASLIIYIGRHLDAKRNAQWLKERDAARKVEIEKYLQEYGLDHPVFPPMRHCREGFGGGLIDLPQTPDDVLIAEVKSELAARLPMSEYPPDLDATCARLLDGEYPPTAVIASPVTISDETIERLKAEWDAAYAGAPLQTPEAKAFSEQDVAEALDVPVAIVVKRTPTKDERRAMKAAARRRQEDV